MSKHNQHDGVSRRQFLKESATLSAAAATVAVSGEAIANEETPPAEPARKQGYQRTAHVAAYYKSARG